ncbi:hypothetical protein AAHC03_09300 [Spirometra sp. Aus1]|nr:unnamed protein product [Spirometra erinaceieuropaei]
MVICKEEKSRESTPEEQKRMLYWKRSPMTDLEDYAVMDGDAGEPINEYQLERIMEELKALRNARGSARYVRPRRMLYWRR